MLADSGQVTEQGNVAVPLTPPVRPLRSTRRNVGRKAFDLANALRTRSDEQAISPGWGFIRCP
jgi:hypothetical protein